MLGVLREWIEERRRHLRASVRALGPMKAPPSRKPRTGDPPGSLVMRGTATTQVARSHRVSVMPDSLPCSASLRASWAFFLPHLLFLDFWGGTV